MERNERGQYVTGQSGNPDRIFKPGVSGNPGGVPRNTPRITTALMKILRTPLGEQFHPVNQADRIALILLKRATIDEDMVAIKEILERTEGKVSVNLNVGTVERLSDQELEDLMRRAGYDPERLADVLDDVRVLEGES